MGITPQEQETLTRVGPGTSMGRLLRHYWFPVAAVVEVPRGTARPVRLLGQDFVLFRTDDDTWGLLDEHCPHRGASLAQGLVDGRALRCPYHGWAFAADGGCVEMPAEADNPALRDRASIGAYRVETLGGLVFAYVGEAPAPLLPRYDLFVWGGVLRDVGQALLPCNWLQIMENSVDPTHVEWLHGHHLAGVRARAGLSTPERYRAHHERIGFEAFEHGIIKRRLLEGGAEEDDDWKVGHPLVFPHMLRVGAHLQHRFQIRVPVDDTHTRHYWYACYRPPEGVALPVQDEVPVYDVPWQDEQGGFITDFVDGGDIMTWVGQGPIADRTRELLVSSDQGVIILRRLLHEQIARVEQGLDPLGLVRDAEQNRLIDLPQEERKFGDGRAFLREALELSHVRHSPLRDTIAGWLEPSVLESGGG